MTSDFEKRLIEDLTPVVATRFEQRLRMGVFAVLVTGLSLLLLMGVRRDLLELLGDTSYLLSASLLIIGGGLAVWASFSFASLDRVHKFRNLRRALWALYVVAMGVYSGFFFNEVSLVVSPSKDFMCTFLLGGSGLLSGLVTLWFVCKAQAPFPKSSAVLALVVSSLVGSVVLQLHCPMDGGSHRFFGHFLFVIPLWAILFPLYCALATRWLRRDARARTQLSVSSLY